MGHLDSLQARFSYVSFLLAQRGVCVYDIVCSVWQCTTSRMKGEYVLATSAGSSWMMTLLYPTTNITRVKYLTVGFKTATPETFSAGTHK